MKAESSKMGAAQPKRPRKKRKSVVDKDTDYTEEPLDEPKPPKRSNRVGKLAELMSMPLDVLFEIFGHLKPFDLLKLARMTKDFRRVLMHRSSTSVWKKACDNVPGLPLCPPGLSDPQWAHLAFDPRCHFCYTTNIRSVEWRLRVRICAKCAKEHIRDYLGLHALDYDYEFQEESASPEREPGARPDFELLVPRRITKHRESYLVDDYTRVKAQYYAMEGEDARKAFVEQRQAEVAAIVEHAILCENWTKGQTNDRTHELQQIRDDRKAAIIDKLVALGWGEDIQAIEAPDSLEDHKLVRQPHRLTERIWKNIERPMIEFMEQMRVKRLQREHVAIIHDRKHSAVRILRAYKNARLPYTEIMPEAVDFCELAPVKAILEQPSDVDVDDSSFSDIVPLIPDLFDEWRKDIERQLIRTMSTSSTQRDRMRLDYIMMFLRNDDSEDDDDADEDEEPDPVDSTEMTSRLKLASTVFLCNRCSSNSPFDDGYFSDDDSEFGFGFMQFASIQPLFYPRVMGHSCLTRTPSHPWIYVTQPDPSKRLESRSKTRKKWCSINALRLDRHLSTIARQIVESVDLDPAVTTAEEMDELDTRFACLHCARSSHIQGQAKAPLFDWRSSIKHHAEFHAFTRSDWAALTPSEVEERRLAKDTRPGDDESSDEIAEVPGQGAVWMCTHCRDLPTEKEPSTLCRLQEHMILKHEILAPVIDQDYYRDFSAPPQGYPSCVPICQVLVADDSSD